MTRNLLCPTDPLSSVYKEQIYEQIYAASLRNANAPDPVEEDETVKKLREQLNQILTYRRVAETRSRIDARIMMLRQNIKDFGQEPVA